MNSNNFFDFPTGGTKKQSNTSQTKYSQEKSLLSNIIAFSINGIVAASKEHITQAPSKSTSSYRRSNGNGVEEIKQLESNKSVSSYSELQNSLKSGSDHWSHNAHSLQNSSFAGTTGRSQMQSSISDDLNFSLGFHDSAPSSGSQVDKRMKLIKNSKIPYVGILDMIKQKIPVKIEFVETAMTIDKNLTHSVEYRLKGEEIGFGLGSTKQIAKELSAEQGVRTILSKGKFATEQSCIAQILKEFGDSKKPNISPQPNTADECNLQNDSSLYELDMIAKANYKTLEWKLDPPSGPNGGFGARVTFDGLHGVGIGNKKIEAKREAALDLIKKIRKSPVLSAKYKVK